MASGILKAFGLSAEQLKKADDAWLNAATAMVNSNRPLTLRQYERLSAVAHSRGKSVSLLIQEEFGKTLDGLIGGAP